MTKNEVRGGELYEYLGKGMSKLRKPEVQSPCSRNKFNMIENQKAQTVL